MTIIFTATQVCDACGETRILFNEKTSPILREDIDTAAMYKGWRPIDKKHICTDCITKVFYTKK